MYKFENHFIYYSHKNKQRIDVKMGFTKFNEINISNWNAFFKILLNASNFETCYLNCLSIDYCGSSWLSLAQEGYYY